MNFLKYILFLLTILTFSVSAYELPNDNLKNKKIIEKKFEDGKFILIKNLDFTPYLDFSEFYDQSILDHLPFEFHLFLREESNGYLENITVKKINPRINLTFRKINHSN